MKKELIRELEGLDNQINQIKKKKEEIEFKITTYAKYKKNDLVLVKEWGLEKKGVILSVFIDKERWDGKYTIHYKIAKAKKDNTAHSSATLGYKGISEDNILEKL